MEIRGWLTCCHLWTVLLTWFYCFTAPPLILLDTCGSGKKGENEELLNAFMGVLLTKTPSKIFPLWERISAKSYVTQPRVWVSNVTVLATFYIEFFKMGTSDALVLYRNRINCYPPCRGTVIFKNGHSSMIVECFHFLFHNCIFLDKQWLCATTYLFINIILPLNKIKKDVHASVESIVVCPIFLIC